MVIPCRMATTIVRTTYALDVETVRKLEELADLWGVSKSEALRRSIRSASLSQSATSSPLEAFKALQASMKLSKREASKWDRKIRQERRNSSTRRLSTRRSSSR